MTNILTEFLKDWKTTGSIAPSSRYLQAGMVDPIDFTTAPLGVELGPGTGCITRGVLNRLRPDARLLAVEINPRMAETLSATIQDPRLLVECDSATRLPAIFARRALPPPAFVVSGLPFANLPPDVRRDVVKAVHEVLPPGGLFVAFQYTPLVLPPLLRQVFGNLSAHPVLFNIPPALVYVSVRSDDRGSPA